MRFQFFILLSEDSKRIRLTYFEMNRSFVWLNSFVCFIFRIMNFRPAFCNAVPFNYADVYRIKWSLNPSLNYFRQYSISPLLFIWIFRVSGVVLQRWSKNTCFLKNAINSDQNWKFALLLNLELYYTRLPRSYSNKHEF